MDKLTVKKWIAVGELDEKEIDQDSILDTAGRLLDRAYSHEILGEVLFEATNGKHYVVTIEACIEEANPEYVKETLSERK